MASRFWKYLYQWPLLLRKQVLRYSENAFIADVDIIHGHALFPAGFFGWQLAKHIHKPFVLTEHWSRASYFLQKHPLGYYGKRVYSKTDTVIFVSKYLKNKIEKKVKLKRTTVIANPISNTVFHYKPKPKLPPIRFTLVAFWKKKGVKRGDLILEAFHEIKQETDIDFQLDYVGTGNALDEYKQKAAAYGLSACFCGFEDKQTLADHLKRSHFLIHATEFETFGIVVFEALKTGTPVLVSNLPVFKHYINHQNGLLVENTISEWKDAILKAIQNEYNYSAIASDFEKPFSEREVAEATNRVYDQVLKQEQHQSTR
jgi:glycosyltransferase involved in cell wall biosynthesis